MCKIKATLKWSLGKLEKKMSILFNSYAEIELFIKNNSFGKYTIVNTQELLTEKETLEYMEEVLTEQGYIVQNYYTLGCYQYFQAIKDGKKETLKFENYEIRI